MDSLNELDYHNSEVHSSEVFLPAMSNGDSLYIGFFHTGAYQESIGGFGGLQHCLIPSPSHIIIDRNENEEITFRIFSEKQESQTMMKLLGY